MVLAYLALCRLWFGLHRKRHPLYCRASGIYHIRRLGLAFCCRNRPRPESFGSKNCHRQCSQLSCGLAAASGGHGNTPGGAKGPAISVPRRSLGKGEVVGSILSGIKRTGQPRSVLLSIFGGVDNSRKVVLSAQRIFYSLRTHRRRFTTQPPESSRLVGQQFKRDRSFGDGEVVSSINTRIIQSPSKRLVAPSLLVRSAKRVMLGSVGEKVGLNFQVQPLSDLASVPAELTRGREARTIRLRVSRRIWHRQPRPRFIATFERKVRSAALQRNRVGTDLAPTNSADGQAR